MKISFSKLAACLFSAVLIFSSCNPGTSTPGTLPEVPSNPTPETPPSSEGKIFKVDGALTLKDDGTADWLITGVDLYDFNNKTVDIDFSAKMKVVNKGEATVLGWSINIEGYPSVCSETFEKGTSDWKELSGKKTAVELGEWNKVYIGTYKINPEDFVIYIKDLKVQVVETGTSNSKTYTELSTTNGVTTVDSKNVPSSSSGDSDSDAPQIPGADATWLSDSVPSIYETYKDQFDYIGMAAEYGNFGLKQTGSDKYTATYTQDIWGNPTELYYEEIQKGIAKHANSITLGNELKPQFLFQWWGGDCNNTLVDFTGSNGKTVKVPDTLNGEKLIYATLNAAKKMGVQMRGHVLTWHAQTDEAFYRENYKASGALVDKATMTTRHEWYIKTVLECVANWEAANGYGTGNHLIWAWDVVNEAMADDAGKTYTGTDQNWLRGSTDKTKNKAPTDYPQGSRWYQIYGNEEFIINAFRFANAYAPSDVKLCYNDYNEYMDYSAGWKTSAIENIVKLIKAGETQTVNGKIVAPRIDVIAMQSHVSPTYPGVSGYEDALKRFLALCDVHVSELDFAAETQSAAVTAYKQYFTMLQKYGKNYSGAHKVTNVTIWGINNESSWINPSTIHEKTVKTYPLLFNLVNNVDGNKKEVTYDTGKEVLPQFDAGDTYKPNDAFWAVIQACSQ